MTFGHVGFVGWHPWAHPFEVGGKSKWFQWNIGFYCEQRKDLGHVHGSNFKIMDSCDLRSLPNFDFQGEVKMFK
jgi:hypothetical protein